ncbi:hypothetical protein Q5H92_03275 [Hymenobacter sp. M29]|uniref:Uncharacterized protein n=1 Tax=Hymenobacter mellowenesis TaxID=3063995 RepID=A0ABT9A694_9BACT|nr:hypothetical protein [Hymenobacter sp. M29]MDO7845365.1 hypothetical protein [Hymenobacter sp. M29]
MIKHLAENADYKVYSLHESVYLKSKATCRTLSDFEESDLSVAWHYGDPASAIILGSNNYIIVAGCGITVYDIDQHFEVTLLNAPDNIWWTDGLHQGFEDDWMECRFVSFFDDNKLRVFKINAVTKEITMLP